MILLVFLFMIFLTFLFITRFDFISNKEFKEVHNTLSSPILFSQGSKG